MRKRYHQITANTVRQTISKHSVGISYALERRFDF